MQKIDQSIPSSEYFEIQRITDGVYAVIGIRGAPSHSNSGIIDLGDKTLVFDTFISPKAAEDLKVAAEHLTGRPVTYVINSHCHSDHWCGNQVFALQSTIISTFNTREKMKVYSDEYIRQYVENPEILVKEIIANNERLASETDDHARKSLETLISLYKTVLDSLPTLQLCFPDQTFTDRLTFYGNQRKVKLISLDQGHTAGDCYLSLPEENIVFLGDLGFFQCQPFMPPEGDPDLWISFLEEMDNSGVPTFVPGHGPLGTGEDLSLQRKYIENIRQLVDHSIEKGDSAEDLLQTPLPAPFNQWPGKKTYNETNLRSLFQIRAGR